MSLDIEFLPERKETELEKGRVVYRPFRYPEAFDFFLKAAQSHWLPTEVAMAGDKKCYEEVLSREEREAIIKILRLFTIIELNAEDYWTKVAEWFPHPEIQQAATTNGSFEAIHIWGYDYLSQSLNLPLSEYEEFLKDPAMSEKHKKFGEILKNTKTIEDRALGLAVFSGFLEGVCLYSSFAALTSFSRFNKMKGVANIVAWSVRDEALHSRFGVWLFNTLMAEDPKLFNKEMKSKIQDAARMAVELEFAYIDSVFSGGEIPSISKSDLKEFVMFRANMKLKEMNIKKVFTEIDKAAVGRITSWFDILTAGNEHTDFFSSKPTAYAKGHVDWTKIKF